MNQEKITDLSDSKQKKVIDKKNAKEEGEEKTLLDKLIEKYPVLSPEEAQITMQKIKEGDDYAKQIFINSNARLLKKYLSRNIKKMPNGITWDDLTEAGLDALEYAVDKFDPNRGRAFSTFAWFIFNKRLFSLLPERNSVVKYSEEILENTSEEASYSTDSNIKDYIRDKMPDLSNNEIDVIINKSGYKISTSKNIHLSIKEEMEIELKALKSMGIQFKQGETETTVFEQHYAEI